MTLARSRFRPRTGIQLGSHAFRVASVTRGPSGWGVNHAFTITRADPTAEIDASDMTWLSQVLDRRGIGSTDLAVGVPSEMLSSHTVTLPAGVPVDADAVRCQLVAAGVDGADAGEVAWWEHPAGRAGDKQHLTSLMLPHAQANMLLSILDVPGKQVTTLESESTALARYIRTVLPEPTGIDCVALVDFDYTLFVAILDNDIIFERVHGNLGLGSVVARLESQLSIERSAVDVLIRSTTVFGSGDDECAAPIVRDRLREFFERLGEELATSVSYVSHQFREPALGHLHLLGSGSGIGGVAAYLEDQLRLPVAGGHGREPESVETSWSELAVPIGLAMGVE